MFPTLCRCFSLAIARSSNFFGVFAWGYRGRSLSEKKRAPPSQEIGNRHWSANRCIRQRYFQQSEDRIIIGVFRRRDITDDEKRFSFRLRQMFGTERLKRAHPARQRFFSYYVRTPQSFRFTGTPKHEIHKGKSKGVVMPEDSDGSAAFYAVRATSQYAHVTQHVRKLQLFSEGTDTEIINKKK